MSSDESTSEVSTPSQTTYDLELEVSVGDFFPYRDGQDNLLYGRINAINPEKDNSYRVSLPEFGHIWLSEDRYDTDAPSKSLHAENTARDLYPRIAEYNGR